MFLFPLSFHCLCDFRCPSLCSSYLLLFCLSVGLFLFTKQYVVFAFFLLFVLYFFLSFFLSFLLYFPCFFRPFLVFFSVCLYFFVSFRFLSFYPSIPLSSYLHLSTSISTLLPIQQFYPSLPSIFLAAIYSLSLSLHLSIHPPI